MKVVRTPKALKKEIARLKRQGKRIGFVPTMGYLHEGHLSLVRLAKKENDAVIASVFVNPLQFGPREDLSRYPRSLKRDAALLRGEKTDLLFIPETAALYPKGFQTKVSVENLSRPLCGLSRLTHFAGVATVVLKLLNLTTPDVLYLGQKDYQQFKVVERMVRDLGLPVKVRMAPIVREPGGLAMSSRNIFLSPKERRQALSLRKAIRLADTLIRSGERSAAKLRGALKKVLAKASAARIDYAEIMDADTLERVVELKKGRRILVALAVCFSRTRLIDNGLITV